MSFANKLLSSTHQPDPASMVPASSLRPGESFYTCLGRIRTIHLKDEDYFIERDEDRFLRRIEKGSFGYDRRVERVTR